MKNSFLIAVSLLLFCIISCKSGDSMGSEATKGKAVLVFRSLKDEISVHIYKPIDDTYNYPYITDKLDIKPNISINYEIDVNNYAFVKCRYSNGQRGEYLVFPGDCIEILCEPQTITLSGSNAEGHKYAHDNYINRGLGYYDRLLYSLITVPIKYDSIYNYLEQELILPCQTDLKQMEIAGSITPKFASVMAKNLYYGLCSCLWGVYHATLIGRHPDKLIKENFTPSAEDIRIVLQQLSLLYETPDALSDDAKKMWYYHGEPYRTKYLYLDDDAKEKLTEGYGKDTFGDDVWLLLASDSLQLRFFSSHLIEDLQSMKPFYGYNQEKLFAWLRNKFPDSEYVAIIKELMEQKQSAKINEQEEVIIVANSPSSIKEMMQLPGIKGKYAYIDLWATWCPSCIAEFKFYDDFHKVLSQYNNIVTVFIAIKDDREIWEKGVERYNLKGYHILSSNALDEDIGMKAYHAKAVGAIPRYLLLDPDGNIVNDNMPRPSRSTELKPILDGVLKR